MMKMMPKLSFIWFAILFYSQVVSARTRANPFFIDYDEDEVLADLRIRQPDITPIQEQDDPVKTIDNQRIISNRREVKCVPRPMPVKIPVPSHYIITPRYVILNRCLGPGHTSVQKCAVTRREKVNVQYTKLSAMAMSDQVPSQEEAMYDHLECGNACIAKPEDCNSKTQIFEDCVCKCKLNDTYCQSINRYYDRSSCQCECKVPTECPLYMEWNPATCQCECAGCIKQMCDKHNLDLDSSECKCMANRRVVSRNFLA